MILLATDSSIHSPTCRREHRPTALCAPFQGLAVLEDEQASLLLARLKKEQRIGAVDDSLGVDCFAQVTALASEVYLVVKLALRLKASGRFGFYQK